MIRYLLYYLNELKKNKKWEGFMAPLSNAKFVSLEGKHNIG